MIAVHRTDPVCCPVCDKKVERRSRQQRYCSPRCKRSANRKAVYALKKSARYPYSGQGDASLKSARQNNGLQRPETGSSVSCDGPINILGGCSFRWSGAVGLDSKTLARIIWSEIGGEVVKPNEAVP
jgi:hypothetical protein